MMEFQDNYLITSQGTIEFPCPIKSLLEIQGVAVVRLEVMGGLDENNNIYGVKGEKVIWQVQDQAEFNPALLHDPYGLWKFRPYSGVRVYEKDPRLIVANDAGGYRLVIDPTNGKILEEVGWTK